jgi:hypothetical protein
MHTTDGMSAGAFVVVVVASAAAVVMMGGVEDGAPVVDGPALVAPLLVQLVSASTAAAAIHEKVCFTGDSSDRSPGRGKDGNAGVQHPTIGTLSVDCCPAEGA